MKRVLIVDDQASNRLILRELLETLEWNCTEASNGVEGLEVVRLEAIDLILTDYHMPEMNGLNLLEELKKNPSTRDIPVIMITAHSTTDIHTQALSIGASAVLPKPFEFEALFRAVSNVVARKVTEPNMVVPAPRKLEILLVEDNEGDVRLTQEALKDVKVTAHLSVVNDGEEAMAFLRRQDSYVNAARPDLVLLDLNLPKKSGHEVLAEVKADKEIQAIPVVVLSSSAQDEDILKAHEHFANCYVTKPTDLNEFWNLIKHIVEFWLVISKIPPKN
ncbi:response regulator [Candidatus Nitrospira salsa]